MNILKNPHFIFDVHVHEVVDASLSVIAQTFMDACTRTEHKLSRVSELVCSQGIRPTVQEGVEGLDWTVSGRMAWRSYDCGGMSGEYTKSLSRVGLYSGLKFGAETGGW